MRRGALLVVAAAGWWVAYRVNGPAWDRLLFDVVGLAPASRLGESVRFFCYDTVKIALLLTGIVFVVTVLRSYMSVERTRALLGGRREGSFLSAPWRSARAGRWPTSAWPPLSRRSRRSPRWAALTSDQ